MTGGDDLQQLCDAGEEEFLEIMALVGMASKPLHVRRLQKALHEWVSNPGKYTYFSQYNILCKIYAAMRRSHKINEKIKLNLE